MASLLMKSEAFLKPHSSRVTLWDIQICWFDVAGGWGSVLLSAGMFYRSLLYTKETLRLAGCIIRANRLAAFAALRSLTGE